MIDTLRQSLISQFEAALCTLGICIDRCPEQSWNERVANLKFCQAVFHTLFYADLYLGRNAQSFKLQPFHRENANVFADYEELEPRPPQHLYAREDIRRYLHHCRTKAVEMIASETAETLADPSGIDWRKCSRLELHIYNIRHIQHHAAQLSLRLRLDSQVDVPWVSGGWKEPAKSTR